MFWADVIVYGGCEDLHISRGAVVFLAHDGPGYFVTGQAQEVIRAWLSEEAERLGLKTPIKRIPEVYQYDEAGVSTRYELRFTLPERICNAIGVIERALEQAPPALASAVKQTMAAIDEEAAAAAEAAEVAAAATEGAGKIAWYSRGGDA